MPPRPSLPTRDPGRGMHLKRILSGLLLLPLGLAVILWSPPPVFVAVVCLLALGCAGELFALSAARGVRPVWPTGLLGAVLIPAAAHAGGVPWTLGALALTGAGTLAWLALSGGDPAPAVARAGVTALGGAYVGGLMAFAVLLRQPPGGAGRLVTVALIAWAGDVAAFYAGRAVGRRRLAPTVSPGKTVEGAAAGLAASMLVAVGAGWAGGAASPLAWGAAGVLVGLAGQVGDLAESLVKRSLGAKDAGWLIPGHGGLLDRLDSLLFALPAFYAVTRLGLVP